MNERQAIETISDALVDAHYWEEGENLPYSEVLAEITVKALLRAGWTLAPPAQNDGEERP